MKELSGKQRQTEQISRDSQKQAVAVVGMKAIRHAGVDSRMIILDDQACQQMTLHFQLSLQCNVSPITGFVLMPDEARDGRNVALK